MLSKMFITRVHAVAFTFLFFFFNYLLFKLKKIEM